MATNQDFPKVTLRKEMRRVLRSLSEEAFIIKSELALRHLENLLSDLQKNLASPCSQFHTIGVFAPMKDEASCVALGKVYELAFPCLEENQMIFRKTRYRDLEASNDFGVTLLAPKIDCEKVIPSVLVVPGLAFDREGNRLGRGKGFYDRYLEKFKGVKIGLCLNEQIKDAVPCEEHDVVMDYIITDEEGYRKGSVIKV